MSDSSKKPSIEQLLESLQQQLTSQSSQMQQMAGRIEDLSRENRNLEESKNKAEAKLKFFDATTIATKARERIESTRQASKNKGKYSYYCLRPDYTLAIGPFFCDETDMDIVHARFLKFYRIHFPAESRHEIVTEREYFRRIGKEPVRSA